MHHDTISSVGRRLRSGEVTSVELTQLMLERITAHAHLNAFVTVTVETAKAQAEQADRELRRGLDRGPLHGVPVAVKDLFSTRGIRTTCGSRALLDWIPDGDARAVVKLREAGAVLLGKTGLHEFAYGTTSINPFFGPIENPWRQGYDPGGSSGGSAAAAAAGLCFAALGTDTGCSVRQPAHCCGVVGYKPTFGLVSKAGAYPLAQSLDHVGSLTRNVDDAAIVVAAIAGVDPCDPSSLDAEVDLDLDPDPGNGSLSGIRIGVMRRHFFEGDADVVGVVDAAIDALEGAGATLIELEIPDIDRAFEAARLTFAETAVVHKDRLDRTPELYSDELRRKLEYSRSISAADYIEAQRFRETFVREIDAAMAACDVLAAPTSTIASAPILNRPEDYKVLSWRNTGIFNLTGQPSISLPCGLTGSGLPVGLMLSARRLQDRDLLRRAREIETVLRWNKQPPPPQR